MTTSRRLLLASAVVVAAVVGWLAYGVIRTVRHLPEAYAAWDTGTLLIEYMKQHEDRWPTSWDDLISVVRSDADRKVPLRGGRAGDVRYATSLADKVSIDWTFDPASGNASDPVTRRDGVKFPVVWSGAEPNEMIRAYLAKPVTTRPTASD